MSDADLEKIPRTGSLRAILTKQGAWLAISLADEDFGTSISEAQRPSMPQRLLNELKRFDAEQFFYKFTADKGHYRT